MKKMLSLKVSNFLNTLFIIITFSVNRLALSNLSNKTKNNYNYASTNYAAPPSVKIFTSFLSDKHKQTSFFTFLSISSSDMGSPEHD